MSLEKLSPLKPIPSVLTKEHIAILSEQYGVNTYGALADQLTYNPHGLKEVLQVQESVMLRLDSIFRAEGLIGKNSTKTSRRKKGVIDDASDEVVGFDGNLVSRQEYERQKCERNFHNNN